MKKKVYKQHLSPVGRRDQNYIFNILFEEDDNNKYYEQLWATRINDNKFKMACIPFYVRDLFFEDIIEIDDDHNLQRIISPSGNTSLRIFFHNPEEHPSILEEINKINNDLIIEHYSTRYIAINSKKDFKKIIDFIN